MTMTNKRAKCGLKGYTDYELLNTPVAKELIDRNYKIIHRSVLKVLIKSKNKKRTSNRGAFDYDQYE